MKKIFILSLLGLKFTVPIFCGITAIQNLAISVDSESSIITSGNPGTLSITLNAEGTGSSTDTSTTYTVTSNTKKKGTLKITGSITSGGNMPTNTSLTVRLNSQSGTSQGTQTLTSTAIDLVTKLPTLVSDTGLITYAFNVVNGWTIAAQTLNRTITLTLTDEN